MDIDKIPTDIIKEKIKLTLMGIDKDVIQMHIDKQKREYDEQMALARQTKAKVKVNEAGFAVGGTAAFMNEGRDAKMEREAINVGKDCSYDPKKDFLKPKTHFYVDMSPKVT